MAQSSTLLFKPKQLKILLVLRNNTQQWYISSIAKSSDTTYVHACNFIAACEQQGLTTSEKHGKQKVVKLTEKGAKVAELLDALKTLIDQKEQQPAQQFTA